MQEPGFTGEAVIRKIRIRLLPLLFALYVIAFLDRVNIGFAALTMNRDLGIAPQQFGLAVGVFFWGYCLFEVPSNLIMHRVGARRWLPRILLSWGVVAVVTGFVENVGQLYIARFLLGVAEAGFFPGVMLYLTYWFRQREQARAIAAILIGMPVTGVLGSPLSGFILDHAHWLGLASWRWLLILEGAPALVGGIVAYLALPDRPETANFLAPDEKRWLAGELQRENRLEGRERESSALRALTSPRVWHLALMAIAHAIGLYTLTFWVPQEVRALSRVYTNTTVGLLVMIPHLVGLAAMIAVSRSSDHRLERKYHIAVSVAIAGVAFLLLGVERSPLVSIVLLSFVAAGAYSFLPPFYSLPNAFLTGASAASGIALITSVANLGGTIGPYAVGFISRTTGTLYGGLSVAGVSLCLSAMLALLLPRRAIAASG